MKVQGKHKLKAPQQKVWDLIMDADALTKIIPGCQHLEETAPGAFEAKLNVGVAPVKGEFFGSVMMEAVQPPESYRMIVEGSGAPGFMRGSAAIRLEPDGDQTVLNVEGDVQVGGVIAGVGQRMLGGVSRLLMGQFFKALDNELANRG